MNFRLLIVLFLLILLLSGCNINKEEELLESIKVLKTENENLKIETEVLKKETDYLRDTQVELLEVHDIPNTLNERIDEYRNYQEGITSYFYEDGKTYILLKAPSSVESTGTSTGIDFDGLEMKSDKITIYYKSFFYHLEKPGLKRLILYEMNGEYKIEFIERYRTEE